MTTEAQIREEAGRLARTLTATMQRARLTKLSAPRGSRFSEIVLAHDGARAVWRSNNAAINPSWNLAGATEFLRIYPGLRRQAEAGARRMQIAEQRSPELARRMRDVGIRSVEISRTRPVLSVSRDDRTGGLAATWRSNNVTVPVTGNAAIAAAFVEVLGDVERAVASRERELARILAGARDLE